MENCIKVTEEIRKFTQEHVKNSRYEHSVRVAEMCARLCRQYGLDDDKGYLAGIGHDMCKDFSDSELMELSARDGKPVSDYEKENPFLLHGRAAAVMMKEKFGIQDEDILEAVANHTSGVKGMCDLTKCLFLADKIEPGRPQSTDEYRERLLKMPLTELIWTVIEENYNYIVKKGYRIYPGTKEMMDFYRQEFESGK